MKGVARLVRHAAIARQCPGAQAGVSGPASSPLQTCSQLWQQPLRLGAHASGSGPRACSSRAGWQHEAAAGIHSAADTAGDTTTSSSSSSPGSISASCDVPRGHVLHEHRSRFSPAADGAAADAAGAWSSSSAAAGSSSSSSSSSERSFLPPSLLGAMPSGTVGADEFYEDDQVLSRFYEEGVHGGLGRRFRRKVPLFQVIEFYASGTAIEEYKPRTPQQLGLHPRDVVLFAPLSRLAAPQRATIVVHEDKVLVKTEIVKAIITPDKAVLIKGRRHADTQKLSQNILAANDQRLMALGLYKQQQAAVRAAAAQQLTAHGCGKAASASQLLRAADVHGSSAAWEQLAEDDDSSSMLPTDSWLGEAGTLPPRLRGRGGGGRKRGAGQRSNRSDLKDVPFGMLVLEVLLDATAEYFYTKVQHLNWMLESVAADIRTHQDTDSQAAVDKAHQLLPIQKFLTSLKNDVKETAQAIKAALLEEQLDDLCMQWHQQEQQRWTSAELQRRRARLALDYPGEDEAGDDELLQGGQVSMIYGAASHRQGFKGVGPGQQVRLLTEMLESYDREIQSLEGSINEAEEDLENTRALWHMQMDSRRNHIIMVNLWLSMLNISVMATTVLPAFFGMNLNSGLGGDEPSNFFLVCGSSLALSALAYPASRSWYNRNWRRVNQNELFEQKMLRTLLVQHIEDIDAITRLAQRIRYKWIDRYSFRQLMMDTLGSRVISPAHIDFLWQAYDSDRDSFIEEAQKIKPLNTYHSTGALSAVEPLPVQPYITTGVPAMPPQHSAGQQQPGQPLPGQQHPDDSWAGLVSESTWSSMEELMSRGNGGHTGSSSGGGSGSSGRAGGSGGSGGGGGSSSSERRRRGKMYAAWDDEWEGPSIRDEDEAPSKSRVMQAIGAWMRRRQKARQRNRSFAEQQQELMHEEQRALQKAERHAQRAAGRTDDPS